MLILSGFTVKICNFGKPHKYPPPVYYKGHFLEGMVDSKRADTFSKRIQNCLEPFIPVRMWSTYMPGGITASSLAWSTGGSEGQRVRGSHVVWVPPFDPPGLSCSKDGYSYPANKYYQKLSSYLMVRANHPFNNWGFK